MKKAIFKVLIFLCLPVGIVATAMIKREPVYKGKSAAVWVDEIRFDRNSARDAFNHLGKAALPALKEGLRSSAPTDRCRAALALGWLGPAAKGAVPDLIAVLDDSRPGVQMEAMEALSRIGMTNEDIVPKLRAKLTQDIIDNFAATLLNTIERERKAANLPPVAGDEFDYDMAFVKSPSPGVRLNGAIKLASLAQRDERAKAALQSLLKDSDASVRCQSARLMTNPVVFIDSKMIGNEN